MTLFKTFKIKYYYTLLLRTLFT